MIKESKGGEKVAKRKETLAIEKALETNVDVIKGYGCEEITIGFVSRGMGKEIVDFMTMDYKGIIRCYEIKVTVSDLKSKAKKSWYGNYNYLVVSEGLREKIKDFKEYTREDVGIIVAEGTEQQEKIDNNDIELKIIKKAKRNDIDRETKEMLKESMIRSLYYKMNKYKDAKSIKHVRVLEKKVRDEKKEKERIEKEYIEQWKKVNELERIAGKLCGKRKVYIEDIIDRIYQKCVMKRLI